MRREPTDAEIKLWRYLRNGSLSGAKFRRQQPIGPYIVDFVCQQAKLIVEQWVATCRCGERRAPRHFLASKGYRIIRFWNNDILANISGVTDRIVAALQSPHPPIAAQWAPPSPSRGEGFKKDLPSA